MDKCTFAESEIIIKYVTILYFNQWENSVNNVNIDYI